MEKTFATTTFANGFLAIVAGVVANMLADNLGYGPRVNFISNIIFRKKRKIFYNI